MSKRAPKLQFTDEELAVPEVSKAAKKAAKRIEKLGAAFLCHFSLEFLPQAVPASQYALLLSSPPWKPPGRRVLHP